jgi:hypothetical protein
MTAAQAKALLDQDPDFVVAKRHDYSLAKLIERYPDGCPDRLIAAVLLMTEDDVAERRAQIIATLRQAVGA